jgi:hypothetical protein
MRPVGSWPRALAKARSQNAPRWLGRPVARFRRWCGVRCGRRCIGADRIERDAAVGTFGQLRQCELLDVDAGFNRLLRDGLETALRDFLNAQDARALGLPPWRRFARAAAPARPGRPRWRVLRPTPRVRLQGVVRRQRVRLQGAVRLLRVLRSRRRCRRTRSFRPPEACRECHRQLGTGHQRAAVVVEAADAGFCVGHAFSLQTSRMIFGSASGRRGMNPSVPSVLRIRRSSSRSRSRSSPFRRATRAVALGARQAGRLVLRTGRQGRRAPAVVDVVATEQQQQRRGRRRPAWACRCSRPGRRDTRRRRMRARRSKSGHRPQTRSK